MSRDPTDATESVLEREVGRIRRLVRERHYAAARDAAVLGLAEFPENRDLLYLAAVSERYLGRIADALRTLVRCEAAHPDYGRLFQERGHCYRAVGETDAALAAYARAVALNPTLHASWSAIADLEQAAGRSVAAASARAHREKLATLPPDVVAATNLFAEGAVQAAEAIVRRHLQAHPEDIEAMRLLARIAVKLDVLDDADFILESLLSFAPGYHAARHEYASVLAQRHRYARAREEALRLLESDPRHPGYRATYALASVGLGRHEEALAVYEALAAETPGAADLHLSAAHALKTLGRQTEAIAAYRRAAAARQDFGDAYWSLANLKTYRFTEPEVAAMRAAEARQETSVVDRYHLCFALGKALEDRGDYAASFRYYARGNALKHAEVRYVPESIERNTALQRAVCTAEFFAARRGFGCPRPDPIFIVGLPRSGSTLVEQILASHSQVDGTMELAEIPRLVQRLQGRDFDAANPRYPGVLATLGADRLRSFGEGYLEETRVYRGQRPFFIDKMPNNFRHVGLIHLMLPAAKIIDARREPLACCFSNFKQLFASGQEFTYSLEDIGRYYATYVELMDHWNRVLPGRVLRVQHEEVVADLEGSVRRILEFCGLPFERACVEFHLTRRSVRTASSEQVRRPIFADGLDQWRHYEAWLGPLRDALARRPGV
jgi:tetratricopeptide (TPR) repeat protein